MKIDLETKFNVGDIVRLKGTMGKYSVTAGWSFRSTMNGPSYRYLVAQITLVTCSAGTQVVYELLPMNFDGHTASEKYIHVNEVLLEASGPFEVQEAEEKKK